MALYAKGFWEKIPPEKSPPDSKRNPIPNLTLTLPLTPHRGLFSGGIFSWHLRRSASNVTFSTSYNKKKFAFYILTYLKSWNYNTKVLVPIIVPCLNRRELLQNLKFYLLQKETLIWWFLLFLWQRVNRVNWLI